MDESVFHFARQIIIIGQYSVQTLSILSDCGTFHTRTKTIGVVRFTTHTKYIIYFSPVHATKKKRAPIGLAFFFLFHFVIVTRRDFDKVMITGCCADCLSGSSPGR